MSDRWVENAIPRTARKRWRCWGNGAVRETHQPECPGIIQPGEPYVEYVGEVPLYHSGSRHSLPCARAYFTEDAA